MMTNDNYYELIFEMPDTAARELLIAQLAEIGYDGFEETDTSLKAYVPEPDFDENKLNEILNNDIIKYSKSIIQKQNWNQLWESNFEPVQVDDFVGVRAGFHPPFHGVQHEIVITPKMSFGTGHHATTWLVMQLMRDIDFAGKTVFDFGTGTGILAILAEKLGAARVLAVDNDDWCIENASENTLINHCNNIDIEKVTDAPSQQQFDIVIANINRHILLENMPLISGSLVEKGVLVISGLLTDDEKDLLDCCLANSFEFVKTVNKNGWIAMLFFKK
jgi:ribosomal protein L11 methyltransferase